MRMGCIISRETREREGYVADGQRAEKNDDGGVNVKRNAKAGVSGEIIRSAQEMIALYEDLIHEFPLISIEDGLDENDWDGWQEMTKRLGSEVLLVGDDLFVTNVKRIHCGLDLGVANAVLIKVNQIGTLTEAMDAIELAQKVDTRRSSRIVPVRRRMRLSLTLQSLSMQAGSRRAPLAEVSAPQSITSCFELQRILCKIKSYVTSHL